MSFSHFLHWPLPARPCSRQVGGQRKQHSTPLRSRGPGGSRVQHPTVTAQREGAVMELALGRREAWG